MNIVRIREDTAKSHMVRHVFNTNLNSVGRAGEVAKLSYRYLRFNRDTEDCEALWSVVNRMLIESIIMDLFHHAYAFLSNNELIYFAHTMLATFLMYLDDFIRDCTIKHSLVRRLYAACESSALPIKDIHDWGRAFMKDWQHRNALNYPATADSSDDHTAVLYKQIAVQHEEIKMLASNNKALVEKIGSLEMEVREMSHSLQEIKIAVCGNTAASSSPTKRVRRFESSGDVLPSIAEDTQATASNVGVNLKSTMLGLQQPRSNLYIPDGKKELHAFFVDYHVHGLSDRSTWKTDKPREVERCLNMYSKMVQHLTDADRTFLSLQSPDRNSREWRDWYEEISSIGRRVQSQMLLLTLMIENEILLGK